MAAPSLHPAPQPHAHPASRLADGLGVRLDHGLGDDDVAARQASHGPNRLPEAPPRPLWWRLLDPFRDVMVVVLLAAALISGAIGEVADTVAILVIVLLNAGIGLWQEWQADRALQALGRMAAPQATVRRAGGQLRQVASEDLVPGDVVLLEAGQRVPADLRLHQVARLKVDESALTGESVTVEKTTAALPEGEPALGDRHNMAWQGTLVTHGHAEGLVVATGRHTELGRVAALLQRTERRLTPLQQRLAAFGRRIAWVVLAICTLVFALGVLRGEPVLGMALTAISLAVAAIPEALPAVVTVLLALGARRLVAVHALVRRLPSVETLGSVTVICSDKTGTLTQNRMQLRTHAVFVPEPVALWTAAVLCNDARAGGSGWVGDPTETALLQAAEAAGVEVAAHQAAAPRRHEWPFDAERKRMATLHDAPSGGWVLWVKGAPETVLPRCRLAGDDPGALALAQSTSDAWAAEGLRVLALARRHVDDLSRATAWDADQAEQALELVGLVGLMDPPRPEARAAVAECRAAGIRPVMITGDHPATALAIARELGIVAHTGGGRVVTGPELAGLDDTALAATVREVAVYARTDPAQKIRIVQALQAQGQFVAMTGDGVNDAPALRQADIGVAMGLGGTDVAREAASLVLLDDHFATIVGAVREGRRIFDNIRKFVRYALTGNSGEIWVLFLAPLVGLPMPLAPLHILWVNLVTDGLPGLALATEPAEGGVMRRPPRAPDESVLAGGLWQHTLWVGLLMGGLCLALQAWALHGDPGSTARAQTLVFTTLTFAQMAHLLAIRSEHDPLWRGLGGNPPLLAAVGLTVVLQLAVVYLPALQAVFRTEALAPLDLALSVGAAAAVALAVEMEKAWRRHGAAATRISAA